MKKILNTILLFLMIISSVKGSQQTNEGYRSLITAQDTVLAFTNFLRDLSTTTDNFLFKQHCTSIINVIQEKL